jgi:Ca2+/H+ antiporter, TMEM165/GDT1 family
VDALTAALVAALIAHAGDRTPAFAARLGDRFAGAAAALIGLALALIAANLIAAAGAALVAPRLTPEAKTLMLGVALLASGAGGLGRLKPLGADMARLGSFGAGLVPGIILMTADRAPFLVFAIGARSPLPWAAAVGGIVGGLAVALPAFYMGETALRPVPLRAIRLTGAAIFLIIGAVLALSALGLI